MIPPAPTTGLAPPQTEQSTHFLTTHEMVLMSRPPLLGSAKIPPAPTTGPAAPQADKRLIRRKPAKSGVRVQCRRGQLGLGADVAVAVVDISDTGMCVVVKAALTKGEDAEVILAGVGRQKPLKLACEVRWCVPDGAAGFRAGLRFRKRIPYAEMDSYC